VSQRHQTAPSRRRASPPPEQPERDSQANEGQVAADVVAAPARLTRSPTELRPHPQAARLPAMEEREYRAFLADVAERGLTTPLAVTQAGIVLDGHQQLRAALEVGLTQVPVRIVAPEDELAYMLKASLRRRNLTPSQRAALALELVDYESRLAHGKERQRANLRRAESEAATLPPRSERVCEYVAGLASVAPRTAQDAITVKEEDPELFERLKAGTTPAHRAARQVRQHRLRERIGQAPPLPEGVFDLIYADPPWASANADSDWAPENHYPTMALEQIKALSVPAADDAVLFLWALGCQLPQALEVIEAWDFRFVAEAVWVKQSIGLGSWVRYRHEPLLIAVRGTIQAPDPQHRFGSVIEAHRRQHSRKPDQVYELIERAYPHCSKLELFARGKARTGWSTWGNEVES
jgi:N6-adenosine-specific RNA methylase IME4/ParB-like chromosome segregation protein Spo0J